MPFISIIVGFRNREHERVKYFLEGLSQLADKDFELIFVDYGSEDKDAALIKKIVETHSFARYYYFDTRGQHWNRSRCLNYGVRHAKADWIFTSDIDFLFRPDFVTVCRDLSITEAAYFKVAFLNEEQSDKIEYPLDKYKIEEYSDEKAIGPLLISKTALAEVGGYDEFYEIWGLEDNDLLFRLERAEITVKFIADQILIWHRWHLPVKQSNILPEGWLKFLSDYFTYKKKNPALHHTAYHSLLDRERPLLHNRSKYRIRTVEVKCGYHFLPLLLKKEISAIAPSEILEVRFNFEVYEQTNTSRLNLLVHYANKAFSRLPLMLSNKNMTSYLSEKEAREVVIYFIKNNSELLRDYILPSRIADEPVYLMKR